MIRKIVSEHKYTFTKFCLVGGLSTIVNYAVFYVLFQFLGINYLISSALGYISGVFIGFNLNKKYTFQSKSKEYIVEIIKYFMVYTVSLFLGLAVLKGQVTILGINILIANVFTIGFTTMTNYIGSRYIVFHESYINKKINYLVYRFRYLINYMIIGLGSILLEIFLINILSKYVPDIRFTTLIGFIAGVLFSFFLNKNLNFKVPKAENVKTFTLFSIISVFAFVLNLLLINIVFIEVGLENYSISRLISSGIIFLISYTLHRRFTFRNTKQAGIAIYLSKDEDLKEIKKKVQYYPDFIHIDLVDNTYKPDAEEVDIAKGYQIDSYWPKLKKMTHIMSSTPSKWIKEVSEFSDYIIIHHETEEDIGKIIKLIKSRNRKAGISLLIDTPIQDIIEHLPYIDLIQILGIAKPGSSSQHMQSLVLKKLRIINSLKRKYNFDVCFDGGVKLTNVHKIDARYIVSGSTVLKSENIIETINAIKTGSRYYYDKNKDLVKFLKKEIICKLKEIPYLVSGTLVGSFVEKGNIESTGDVDIIVIVDKLTKSKFDEIRVKFSELKEILEIDFDKRLVINSTLGPLKFNKPKNVVLHLMMYDIASHIKHCQKSPFTCYDWQRSQVYVNKHMGEIYNVSYLEPSYFLNSRRGIKDYMKDLTAGKISYRKYSFEGNKIKEIVKYKKMKNKDYFEFSIHIMKFIMLNFLKMYNKDNNKMGTKQLMDEYFKIFPDEESKSFFLRLKKSFFLRIKKYKQENKFPKWSRKDEKNVERFLRNFKEGFTREVLRNSRRFYFVRHHKTFMNKGNLFIGQRNNPPINVLDKKIVQNISQLNFGTIYSSPLKRCIETSELIKNEKKLNQIIVNDHLIEIDYGEADGMTYSKLKEKYPFMIDTWYRKEDPKFPKGENMHDVEERVKKFLQEILQEKVAE